MVSLNLNISVWVLLVVTLVLNRDVVVGNPHKILISATESSAEVALVKWRIMEKGMLANIEKLIDQVMKMLLDGEGSDLQISDDCISDVLKVVSGIRKMKLWAIKLLDAIGKPQAGLLMGSVGSYGSYEECLAVRFPESKSRSETTVGKYCLLDIRAPLPPKKGITTMDTDIFEGLNSTLETEVLTEFKQFAAAMYSGASRTSVCVPSTCTENDLRAIINSTIAPSQMTGIVYSCETKQPFKLNLEQKISIGVLSFILLLNIAGLLSDLFAKNKVKTSDDSNNNHNWLSIFSPLKNLRAVMKTNSGEERLRSLNGLRFISAAWVVLCHTYLCMDFMMMDHTMNFRELRKGFLAQPIYNGGLSVESFFVITGTLVAYGLVMFYDKIGSRAFNVPIMVLKRIWRLLPTEMIVMCVTFIFPLLGSGPLWHDVMDQATDACKENWWNIPLFLNNMYPMNIRCMPHTWYISVDFQIFNVFMIYFFLLFKKPILGNIFLVFMVIVSTIVPGALTYALELQPAPLVKVIDQVYLSDVHQRLMLSQAYNHFGGFAIGAALGTALARQQTFKISKMWLTIGWLVASFAGVLIVFGVQPWNAGKESPLWEYVLYAALHRNAWAICVAWVIFVCVIGKGGLVNEFLSWGGFQPLTRISYALYVVHYIIIYSFGASLKSTLTLSHKTYMWLFFGNMVISTLAALAIAIFVEGPLNSLSRIFFSWLVKRGGRTNKKKEEKETELEIKTIKFVENTGEMETVEERKNGTQNDDNDTTELENKKNLKIENN